MLLDSCCWSTESESTENAVSPRRLSKLSQREISMNSTGRLYEIIISDALPFKSSGPSMKTCSAQQRQSQTKCSHCHVGCRSRTQNCLDVAEPTRHSNAESKRRRRLNSVQREKDTNAGTCIQQTGTKATHFCTEIAVDCG